MATHLAAEREGDLPSHLAVPQPLHRLGHLLPGELACEVGIALALGHQRHEGGDKAQRVYRFIITELLQNEKP